MSAETVIRFLDAPAWQQRRQRLQELGGPPLPGGVIPEKAG